MIINPSEVSVLDLQAILAGSVAPRPIALVSTVSKDGTPNLSPFSFFNSFSINPPVLVFSPSRRVRDNSLKHTYDNLQEIPEACINVVTFSMVEQVNLSSTEYEKGVNEFVKSGLTAVKSSIIKPFGVKESPVRFECKVLDIIELGKKGGSGNLVICEILLIHLSNEIINTEGKIDPHKIDLVGRLGEDYYCRASGDAIFRVRKPLQSRGIGIDQLPDFIKHNDFLSGNDLGKLGNTERLPEPDEIEIFRKSDEFRELYGIFNGEKEKAYQIATELLKRNEIWKALLWLCSLPEEKKH